jgi:hypothetical protein
MVSNTQKSMQKNPQHFSNEQSLSIIRNSIGDLALHDFEIEARLRNVTVFSLIDCNSGFVSITGPQNRTLCPFFINRETAKIFQLKLAVELPAMVKSTKIVTIGLERYFKYVNSEAVHDEDMKNVIFRLLPDSQEVKHAIRLLRIANARATVGLEGIPLFQVEALNIKATWQGTKAVPLFLSKEDADLAVFSSFTSEEKFRVSSAKAEQGKALTQFEKASNLFQIAVKSSTAETLRNYKSQLIKTKKHLDRSEMSQTSATHWLEKPGIEVGCLEWVIQQMEIDKTATWTDVVFIPPGFVQVLRERKIPS